ncbi:MAG TPA: GNAT family N-acetyltransferase [Polyangiales bacterium]|nr:GNAT family N-acetyltransferase [Polyangiales bacterium]
MPNEDEVEMIIRQATSNDLARIGEIHRQSILELCKTHYTPAQLADWTSALRPAAYEALLASHRMIAAEDGAELLGFGVFDPNTGLINATYVDPSAARRGVGRALLTALENQARAASFGEVRLNATLNAVGFYARLGYVSRGRESNRLPSGVDLPCEMMRKHLA